MTPLKLSILACCLLSGCASAPSSSPYLSSSKADAWYAKNIHDELTDKDSCIATVRAPTYVGYFFMFYPFAEINDKGLFVGVRSNHGMPVGDIQLRVDSNPAWNISVSETLITLQPTNPAPPELEGNGSDAKTYRQAMDAATKVLSPFIAATGEKAASILAEMSNGKELIYRTSRLDHPGVEVGRIKLDASLVRALDKCKIGLNRAAGVPAQ